VDGFRIQNGAVTIVDSNGVVIAHPDRQQVGTQIDQQAVAGVFRGLEGATSYMRSGESYLAAYAPVGPPLGWGVVVEQEQDAALSAVGRIGLAASLATLLSAVSLALLLSTVIDRALTPVHQLSKAAAEIAASGDLRAVPAVGKAGRQMSEELATLSGSFNQMIDRLRLAQEQQLAWNEVLEERVVERTAQLQTVLEVAKLSTGTLEERVVLQTLLEQVGRLVEFDAATVRLSTPAGDELEVAAASGMGAAALRRRISLSKGILAEVMQSREPRLVVDTDASPAYRDAFGDDQPRGSWLGVPLVAHAEPVGTLSVYVERVGAYSDEHATLLTALGGQVAIALAHARLYDDSVRRVEQELQTARQIQRHLFPEHAPTLSGLDIATYYRPARETTGDFYSFVTPTRNGKSGGGDSVDLFIGDVSGKSLPAALLMTMARTTLYAAASGGEGGPVETLRHANAVLVGDMPRGSFVASTFARLDRAAGTCTLVNAAQPAPLLVRGGDSELLEGPGAHLPLGIVESPEYEALTVPLYSGDLLLFYTDGVIEAFSPEGELFGFERLAEVGVASQGLVAHEVVEALMTAVSEWMGPRPQHDDIAILVVRVTEGWGR
jgi:serine phosphatase RsbU (regulator of sigma subunit)